MIVNQSMHIRSIRSGNATTPFVVAVAIDLAVLFVLGWLVLIGPPAVEIGITQQAVDRWFVTSVATGGDAWNDGVRPGMEVLGVDPPNALSTGDWGSMLVTDGVVQITIQRHDLPPGVEPLFVAVVAFALALGAYRVVPSLAWLLALVPPVAASLSGALVMDPPGNLGLELAGPLVGALFLVASARPRPAGARIVVAATGIAVIVAWAFWFLTARDDWVLLRDASAGLSIGLALVAGGATVNSALARARARSGASISSRSMTVAFGLVADELVPGRSRTRLSAIERERSRLATELHADVLPDLTAVIQSIEEGASPEEAAERLRGIATELRDLMAERRLTVLERLGLVPALESLVEQVARATGVTIELDVENASLESGLRPPRDVELTAYRICQQALDNALLHARPKAVRVRLDVDAGRAELEVSDDGRGIQVGDEERALRSGHLGLADMRERAAAIGGALRVESRPGGGTLVLLRWPV